MSAFQAVRRQFEPDIPLQTTKGNKMKQANLNAAVTAANAHRHFAECIDKLTPGMVLNLSLLPNTGGHMATGFNTSLTLTSADIRPLQDILSRVSKSNYYEAVRLGVEF